MKEIIIKVEDVINSDKTDIPDEKTLKKLAEEILNYSSVKDLSEDYPDMHKRYNEIKEQP